MTDRIRRLLNQKSTIVRFYTYEPELIAAYNKTDRLEKELKISRKLVEDLSYHMNSVKSFIEKIERGKFGHCQESKIVQEAHHKAEYIRNLMETNQCIQNSSSSS